MNSRPQWLKSQFCSKFIGLSDLCILSCSLILLAFLLLPLPLLVRGGLGFSLSFLLSTPLFVVGAVAAVHRGGVGPAALADVPA